MKSRGVGTDGLHFDGPSNDIRISNCSFSTEDDSIALNCPEGYSGDISRVSVDNCTFDSWSLMRLYTANGGPNKFNIDSVRISNCNGKLREAAFLIGTIGGSNPKSVDGLIISDCQLTAPTILAMAENFGSISLKNVTFTPWASRVVWVAPQLTRLCAVLRPSPLYGNVSFSGSSLSLENCTIVNNGKSLTTVVLDNDSTIDNLTFDGLGLQQDGSFPSLPSLVDIRTGSISELVLNSVNSANIDAPVLLNQFSEIGAVSGTGVLATGWEFPDTVMADGVPYMSASTGRPSIKINGIVKPYTA
jgi:hypothetical protein